MIGIVLAIISAATSAFSVVIVRKYSNHSSAFNISLAVSWVGMLVLWPLALVLTDFSLANIGSILIFALSGVLTPGFVRLMYYQEDEKVRCPSQFVLIRGLSALYLALSGVVSQ
jgi:drug/metabolite transporter (DMT)-like permease